MVHAGPLYAIAVAPDLHHVVYLDPGLVLQPQRANDDDDAVHHVAAAEAAAVVVAAAEAIHQPKNVAVVVVAAPQRDVLPHPCESKPAVPMLAAAIVNECKCVSSEMCFERLESRGWS